MFPFPVIDERGHGSEWSSALRAEEGALAGVHDHVDLALLSARERLLADVALERTVAWKTTGPGVVTWPEFPTRWSVLREMEGSSKQKYFQQFGIYLCIEAVRLSISYLLVQIFYYGEVTCYRNTRHWMLKMSCKNLSCQ